MNMRIWMILGCVLVGSGCSRAFIIEPVAGQVIERGIPDNQLLSIGVCLFKWRGLPSNGLSLGRIVATK